MDSEGELLVDGAEPRSFHPFLFPFQADADQLLSSYCFAQPHPRDAPVRYLLDLMTWPVENLPAKVAIDHAGSSTELTAADSGAVWEVLDRMEDVTGLDVFEPVVADPSWWTDETSTSGGEPFEPGIIRLVHAPPQWRGLPQGEEDGSVHDRDLESWVEDGRFTAFRERHLPLSAGTLVVGEFEPLRLARELVLPEAMMPSVIGERRILLELPALPGLQGDGG